MTQKGIRVIIRKEVGEELHKLNKAAKEEKRNGIKGSEKQKLLASITKAINKLKIDPVAGIQIPMKLMPKRYVAMADVSNLWKMNLALAWRLIYTLRTDEIEILAIILDVVPHETYDSIFGYKKK